MKIKHSKFKNIGLIYELLVKQITSDLMDRKDSPAVNILRKYYTNSNSPIVQEYGLYRVIAEGVDLTTMKANNLINAVLQAAKTINVRKLSELRYQMVSEIKEHYDVDKFFSVPVKDYKTLAALYCLLETERSGEFVDPKSIVYNKMTLLEHMIRRLQPQDQVVDNILEEYSNYDKDLRLLVFKVLLEKYNEKYGKLLGEQKAVLKRFMSIGSEKELQEYVNEEFSKLLSEIQQCQDKVPAGIEKIKLKEAMKMIQPVPATEKVGDDHIIRVLQFYDLLYELKKII